MKVSIEAPPLWVHLSHPTPSHRTPLPTSPKGTCSPRVPNRIQHPLLKPVLPALCSSSMTSSQRPLYHLWLPTPILPQPYLLNPSLSSLPCPYCKSGPREVLSECLQGGWIDGWMSRWMDSSWTRWIDGWLLGEWMDR